MLAIKISEDRDTEPLKDVVCVEETTKHLCKVRHHIVPADGRCAETNKQKLPSEFHDFYNN